MLRSTANAYLNFPLIWKLLIGLAAGTIIGLTFGEQAAVLAPAGDLFLRLLQMLVIPLIVVTLILGVSSLTPRNLGRIGGKVMGYYLVTTFFAMALGLGIALLVHPGRGLSVDSNGAEQAEEAPSLTDVFLNMFPENIFLALSQGDILAIMFFVLIAGFALAYMNDHEDKEINEGAQIIRKVFKTGQEIVFLLVRGVLEYSPIGVMALIAVSIGEVGVEALVPLGKLILVVVGATLLMLAFYAVLLGFFKASPIKFFSAARAPMLTAIATRSSSATLPVTTRAANQLNVPKRISSFALPLGATINMDGTAIYVGASVIFVADTLGVQLTFGEIVSVLMVGVLASIGTAGVPGAGLIMLTMAVGTTGMSMAPIALVAGIDAILDMARTMTNIVGDLTGSKLVAASEEKAAKKNKSTAEEPAGSEAS
ncbi:dicarboxylate/amino acid:cation symporter [Corynebacterium yudongzhengii]|nr:dicarboxylate/amino acid:cation symporter [Corynebacterium yudongzhengii]